MVLLTSTNLDDFLGTSLADVVSYFFLIKRYIYNIKYVLLIVHKFWKWCSQGFLLFLQPQFSFFFLFSFMLLFFNLNLFFLDFLRLLLNFTRDRCFSFLFDFAFRYLFPWALLSLIFTLRSLFLLPFTFKAWKTWLGSRTLMLLLFWRSLQNILFFFGFVNWLYLMFRGLKRIEVVNIRWVTIR